MNKVDVKKKVWRTVQALNHAWAVEGDADRLKEYFHPHMVAVTATDRLRLEGRKACIASWKAFVERVKVIRWEEHDPKIQLYGDGTFAIVTYYYDMAFVLDGHHMELGGRDMFVLIEENERWWVVADQFSSFPRD